MLKGNKDRIVTEIGKGDYEILEISDTGNCHKNLVYSRNRSPTSLLVGFVPTPTDAEVAAIVNSLKFLQKSSKLSDIARMIWIVIDMIWRSIIVALSFTSTSLLVTFGYFILNKNNENDKQAAFGIYLMLRTILYSSFCQGLALKLSLAASQSIGRGDDYGQSKKFFTQAILMYIIFMLLVYLPFLIFSRQLLTAASMTQFIADGYYDIAWKALLGDFFVCIQMFLMEFCYSQMIESIFAALTWINLIASGGLILVLDFKYGYSFDGWIIGRMAFYMLNSIAFFMIYMTQTHKDSRGFCSLTAAMKKFSEFLLEGTSYWIGNLAEFMSWESSTFFVGLTRDTTQMAAFGSLMNILTIICDIGAGFLTIGRTRVNYLLGAGLIKASKKMAALAFLSCVAPAIIFGLLLFFSKNHIALLYSSNDLIEKGYLVRLIEIYSFFIIIELSYYLLIALMRTANQVLFSSLAYLFIGVGGNTVICTYLYHTNRLNCAAIGLSMYFSLSSAYLVCLVRMFTLDWHKIKIESADCSKIVTPDNELK